VRDRHAQQRRGVAGGDARVGGAGLRQRDGFVGGQVGAQRRVRLAAGQEVLATSVADTSFAFSWRASSATTGRAAPRSFDHLGHQEQAALHGGGAALVGFALVGLAGDVVAQAQVHVLDRGHRVRRGSMPVVSTARIFRRCRRSR
jgi:hypothetical protein